MPPSPSRLLEPLGGLSLPAKHALWLLGLAAGGLAVLSQRRRRPGWPRLLAAAPVVLANLAAPLLFDGETETLSNFFVAIATAWITNAKVLAWAMGRGSLERPLSLPHFLAVYAMPVTPAESERPEELEGSAESEGPAAAAAAAGGPAARAQAVAAVPAGTDPQAKRKGMQRRFLPRLAAPRSGTFLAARFLARLAGLTLIAHVLVHASLPTLPMLLVEVFSQYLILATIADVLHALATLLGLPILAHSENPYASTSVSDFWNRRCNLVASHVMRTLIYEPLMEGRTVRRPGAPPPARFSRGKRLVAVQAVFVASGAVYEGLYWYHSGRFTPTLLWLRGFSLWGGLMVAENYAKRGGRCFGLELPTLLARALFLTLLHWVLGKWWFPPLKEMGVMQKGAWSIVQAWQALWQTAAHLAARIA